MYLLRHISVVAHLTLYGTLGHPVWAATAPPQTCARPFVFIRVAAGGMKLQTLRICSVVVNAKIDKSRGLL